MAGIIEAHAFQAVVEERIAELRGYLRWFRTHQGWIVQERVDTIHELRYLLRLRRKARAIARPIVEREDPLTLAKGDHHVYPMGVGR